MKLDLFGVRAMVHPLSKIIGRSSCVYPVFARFACRIPHIIFGSCTFVSLCRYSCGGKIGIHNVMSAF